jgi:hypothetical protein
MLRDKSLIPLSHQHQRTALCVLTNRSLKEDRSEENVARLAGTIVDRYEVELNHFRWRRRSCFPLANRS